MARLALGLRTRLQNDAGNAEGWLMRGAGMVLGDAGTATGAYANAYHLAPKNRDAALGYAEALTRSSDPEDNRRGGELLRQLVSRDHTDIRVLSLYAFSAFEQQRSGEGGGGLGDDAETAGRRRPAGGDRAQYPAGAGEIPSWTATGYRRKAIRHNELFNGIWRYCCA